MHFAAYSLLARGKIFGVDTILKIATNQNISLSQVSLAWLMNHDAIPIPKATGIDQIQDNLNSINLKLTPEEICKICCLNVQKRLFNLPIMAPKW